LSIYTKAINFSDLVLVQNHIGNSIDDWIVSSAVRANQLPFLDIGLIFRNRLYLKQYSMQFLSYVFIFQFWEIELFGENFFSQ